MENTENRPKAEQIGEILTVYNALRVKNVVKSQKEFAQILGISEQTLSAAIRGRGNYLTPKLCARVRDTASKHGVQITTGDNSPAVQTGDNFGEQKILSSDNEKWFALVSKKIGR